MRNGAGHDQPALLAERFDAVQINVTINGNLTELTVAPNELLIHTLRKQALFSVKDGCETGECGSGAVLLEGKPTPRCMLLAAQVDGKAITTLAAMATGKRDMHPLQLAFAETAAIRCGYSS